MSMDPVICKVRIYLRRERMEKTNRKMELGKDSGGLPWHRKSSHFTQHARESPSLGDQEKRTIFFEKIGHQARGKVQLRVWGETRDAIGTGFHKSCVPGFHLYMDLHFGRGSRKVCNNKEFRTY